MTRENEKPLPKNEPLAAKSSSRRVLVSIAATFAGFLVAALLIHISLPRHGLALYANWRSEKLKAFALADPSSISVAFFGTSHVNEGLIPNVWDQAFSKKTRSFNLGVNGGSQTEQRRIAQDYFARQDSKPCLTLLELNAGMNFTLEHIAHPRMINIYDSDTLKFVASYRDNAKGFQAVAGRDALALTGFIENAANLGMLSGYLMRDKIDAAQLDALTIEDRRGYSPDLETPLPENSVSPRDLARIEEIPEAVPEGAINLIRELRRLAPPYDQFMFIRTPLADDLTRPKTLPSRLEIDGAPVPILNLASRASLELINRQALWVDHGHLNPEGAEIETRRAAMLAADAIDHDKLSQCEAARALH